MDAGMLTELQSTLPDVRIAVEIVEGSNELTDCFKGKHFHKTAANFWCLTLPDQCFFIWLFLISPNCCTITDSQIMNSASQLYGGQGQQTMTAYHEQCWPFFYWTPPHLNFCIGFVQEILLVSKWHLLPVLNLTKTNHKWQKDELKHSPKQHWLLFYEFLEVSSKFYTFILFIFWKYMYPFKLTFCFLCLTCSFGSKHSKPSEDPFCLEYHEEWRVYEPS